MNEDVSVKLPGEQPLKGVRVLELATVLAGPLAGSFWAGLGAEVIKVERPGSGANAGDVTRSWRAKGEATEGPSAYYAAANFGKTVVRKDLSTSDGQNWLEGMLGEVDLVVQNFRPESAGRMGLDIAGWCKRFPRLIHIQLLGFLHEPGRSAYDVLVQAEAGYMSMNGEAEGPPLRMPVALMDVLAAHQMQGAALAALFARERSGRGAHIEVWLDAAALAGLVNRASATLMGGEDQHRMGSAHPQIAPYGDVFNTRDGSVVTAVGTDAQFRGLCQLIGAADKVQNARFSSNGERVNQREALLDYLAPHFAHLRTEDVLGSAREARVPLGEIRTVSQALASQAGRSMLRTEMQDGMTTQRLSSLAFRMTSS
jgi:crotonobetainyl-CoA:carnitine CoA-transferase CaiB-like acyl-CoA transferase